MKDKRITLAARVLLVLLNVGLFTLVWLNYYNAFAFRAHRFEGALGSIAAFYIIYAWLSKLYRATSIASSSIEETVLSQFISFGIADLVLYVAANLLYRHYVNVLPGALTVLLQLVGSTLIIWQMKRYMLRHIRPSSTLLIYGGAVDLSRAQEFVQRLLHKYSHLFAVDQLLDERDESRVLQAIDARDAVLFMEIDANRRAVYMERCLEKRKVFFFVPEFADIICRGCTVKNFLDTPLMRYDYNYDKRQSYLFKRLCDIVFSLLFLVLLSPVMLVAAIAIRLEDGGPVFYRQERVTLDGKSFNILKFRSMVVDAERYGAIPATENDPRITKVGRLLRKTQIGRAHV